ncbi:MAG: SRPBCC family protein [Gallionellaceae bacterium]
MSHSVTVSKSPEQVFDFITYRMAEYNLSIAKAHDKFEILKGDGLTEGAVFVAEEYQEDEGVRNRYVVKKVIPNRLIYYASTPSLIYEKKNGEWVQTGSCNAYVYFDLEGNSSKTQLTQTIVIEMHNFFSKFLIDMVISGKEGNEWMDHLVEELESLKAAIERHN